MEDHDIYSALEFLRDGSINQRDGLLLLSNIFYNENPSYAKKLSSTPMYRAYKLGEKGYRDLGNGEKVSVRTNDEYESWTTDPEVALKEASRLASPFNPFAAIASIKGVKLGSVIVSYAGYNDFVQSLEEHLETSDHPEARDLEFLLRDASRKNEVVAWPQKNKISLFKDVELVYVGKHGNFPKEKPLYLPNDLPGFLKRPAIVKITAREKNEKGWAWGPGNMAASRIRWHRKPKR